jgi:hypothetical protein
MLTAKDLSRHSLNHKQVLASCVIPTALGNRYRSQIKPNGGDAP